MILFARFSISIFFYLSVSSTLSVSLSLHFFSISLLFLSNFYSASHSLSQYLVIACEQEKTHMWHVKEDQNNLEKFEKTSLVVGLNFLKNIKLGENFGG